MQKIIISLLISSAIVSFFGCASPRYAYLNDGKNNNAPSSKTAASANKNQTNKHELRGEASWYGPGYHGKTTANGEKFNQNDMTAAHKTLPFNTKLKVTDLQTGRSVIVRVNDRGPYVDGRIIDLSKKAAERLGIKEKGTASVKLEIIK